MKKKKNQKSRPLTKLEANKREKQMLSKVDEAVAEYQKEFSERLEEIKFTSTKDATIVVKALLFRALNLSFGFGKEEIDILNQIEQDIAKSIGDGTYTYDQLLEDLDEIGVDVYDEWRQYDE